MLCGRYLLVIDRVGNVQSFSSVFVREINFRRSETTISRKTLSVTFEGDIQFWLRNYISCETGNTFKVIVVDFFYR